MIVKNQLPIDINFRFNYVDVRDVANGMIAAAEKGRSGERYILGNEQATSTAEIIELAQSLFPGIRKPAKLSKTSLLMIAFLEESYSKISGKVPMLLRSQVKAYSGVEQRLNISKAKKELGYDPRSPEQALREALIYFSKQRRLGFTLREIRLIYHEVHKETQRKTLGVRAKHVR